tara:strand:- start:120 stop:1316 length:1197 start_codon:yes stop_codon:yes gene_type:complete
MKSNYKFPLATSTWNQSELKSIKKVIKSNKFTMGKNVLEFEKKFADYLGVRHCIMVNSGSSANLLMIASLFFSKQKKIRLKPNDEVIVPAVSWSTTYFPLFQYNLKVKFCDINIKTLNLDLNQLENLINPKTKLIFLVNLGGNPNDFNKIKKIISKKNINLIEDNCESLGAEFLKKKTGTFGIMGSFSFYFSHHISTMEGGMIATNNTQLKDILLSIRAHGWTRNLSKKNTLVKINENNFHNAFNFILPGYNVRPLEFSGAIGLEQLKKLNSFLKIRRSNAAKFSKIIKKSKLFYTQEMVGNSSWFWFTFILKKNSNLKRSYVLDLFTKHGFETRPVAAGNFTKNIAIKYFKYSIPKKLINADYIHENAFVIGNNPKNMDSEFKELQKLIEYIENLNI